jgi:hypothetical protein
MIFLACFFLVLGLLCLYWITTASGPHRNYHIFIFFISALGLLAFSAVGFMEASKPVSYYSNETEITPQPSPTQNPCGSEAEQAERSSLVQHYGYDSQDALTAGRNMMNSESGCAADAQSAQHHAEAAHHYALASMAYLFMAVHGLDMFGSKKGELEGAIQGADIALHEDGVSDEDQKLASDTKQSAQEKLDALKSQ